jgi:fumarylacetoacetase
MYWTMNQQLTPYLKRLSCKLWRYDGIRNDFRSYKRGLRFCLNYWGGKNPIKLNDGTERKFINDNDTVIMKGFCQNGQVRIGFEKFLQTLTPLSGNNRYLFE